MQATTEYVFSNPSTAPVRASLQQAKQLAANGEHDSAIVVFTKAIALARQQKDFYAVAHGLYDLGFEYICKENYTKAEKITVEAKTLAHTYRYDTLFGRSIMQHCVIKRLQDNEAEAVKLAIGGLKFTDTVPINPVKMEMYNQLALIFGPKDRKKASEYVLQSAKYLTDDVNESANYRTLLAVIQLYEAKNDYQQVFKWIKKAEPYAVTKMRKKWWLHTMAEYYKHEGQPDQAVKYHLESLAMAIDIDDPDGISQSYARLADLERDRGNYRQAIGYSQEGLENARKNQKHGYMLNMYDGLIKSYEKLEDFETANQYHRLRYRHIDSVHKLENQEAIHKMETQYRVEQKDIALKLAHEEARTAELEKQKSEQQTTITIILLVSLLVVFVLLLFRFAENRKKNRLLEKALEEREVLLREIHHRVKNNLQIITSLLNLQSNFTGTKNAEDILRDSQDRIKSMALLHEKLYQTTDLKSINIREYLESLMENLDQSYSFRSANVKTNLHIETAQLDIDMLIPCGLIVNEIATNSIKYAFNQLSEGILTLTGVYENGNYKLTISDNGPGLPADFNPEKSDSLGLKLAYGLSRQLKGKLNYQPTAGAAFTLVFPVTVPV